MCSPAPLSSSHLRASQSTPSKATTGAPIPRITVVRKVSAPPRGEESASTSANTSIPYQPAAKPATRFKACCWRMACASPAQATVPPHRSSTTCGSSGNSPTSASRRPSRNRPIQAGRTASGPRWTDTAHPTRTTMTPSRGTDKILSAGIHAGSTAKGRHNPRLPRPASSTSAVPVKRPKTRGESASTPRQASTQATQARPLPASAPTQAKIASMGKEGPSAPKTGNHPNSPSTRKDAPSRANTPSSPHRPARISARQTATPRSRRSGATAKKPSATSASSNPQRTEDSRMEPGPKPMNIKPADNTMSAG